MGWFTGKPDSPAMDPAQSTIGDKEWRNLQTRAAKANPDRASWTSEKATQHRLDAAKQYRNRGQS